MTLHSLGLKNEHSTKRHPLRSVSLIHIVLTCLCCVCCAKSLQSCPALCDPMDCSLPVSSVHGILQARILEWIAVPSPGNLPNPGIEPRSPALQADSLPAEPPGKPKNTGMGSQPLLRWIFLTQESNRGLLHCRWILYQLSYQATHFGEATIRLQK